MWIHELCPNTAQDLIIAILHHGQLSSIEYHTHLKVTNWIWENDKKF